jgi:hypothetical protein
LYIDSGNSSLSEERRRRKRETFSFSFHMFLDKVEIQRKSHIDVIDVIYLLC